MINKEKPIRTKIFFSSKKKIKEVSYDRDFSKEYYMSRQLFERFGFVLNPEKDFNHDDLDADLEFRRVMSYGRDDFLQAALESGVFSEKGKYKILVNINCV